MTSAISRRRAICYAIAGFTCFVLCDSVMKSAGRTRVPNYEIVAFLGILMSVFIGIYAWWQGEVEELWPKRPARLMVRGLLDLGNNLCVVVAVRHLPLTLFYILVFTSPMLIAVLGRLFLHERLDCRKTCAILVGFLGVVVAVFPSQSRANNGIWIGVGACAVCVSCFSIAIAWSRVIAQAERAESMTFFSGLVSGVVGLLAMLFHAAPVTGGLLGAFVAMGLLGAVGSILMFMALRSAPAATVGNFHYSQLVTGVLVAYLFFHEKPNAWMLAGAALIVASGLYIAVRKESEAIPRVSRPLSGRSCPEDVPG